MSDKIIVMQKAGMSYVKLGSYGSFGGNYVVNGEPAQQAPGNPSYAIVSGNVTSIERKVAVSRGVIGYAIYERYKEITQLPHEQPADAFTRDEDGDLCGENAEFYHVVYDNPEPTLQSVDFEIIDRDCEPVAIPPYVTIDFPNNIAKFPETQHKYPCHIGYEKTYELLRTRILEHVNNGDGKFHVEDYASLQSMTVSENIAIPYHATKMESYYPTPRSRNPKTRTVVLRNKRVKIFTIHGKYQRGERKDGIIFVDGVRGENYADLTDRLEAYIQTFISQLADGKREVCAHCHGEGIVNVTGGIA